MTVRYYDRTGKPLDSVEHMAMLLEDPDAKRVAEDHVGDYWVSTVWLGLDHQFGDGPPLIFETMVFNEGKSGMLDLYCDRYSTEEQALAGHKEIVEKLRAGTLELYGDDE